MSEENKNQITYDENWQSVSSSEYPETIIDGINNEEEVIDDANNKIPKKKNNGHNQLLVTIQLIICLLIALSAFVIKSFGGEIYQTIQTWYYSQLNSSVIFDNNSENMTFDKIFSSSTRDET